MEKADVVVIGAGPAGLTCARALESKGNRVLVLDKGRGVGGRCATRRVELAPGEPPVMFDHGPARFHKLPDPIHAELDQAGVIEPDPFDHSQFRCVRGNSALGKHLSQGLDVRTSVQISAIERAGDSWLVGDSDGRWYPAASLVLAIPPDQARVLLGGHVLVEQIRQVTVKPAWAVLLGFDRKTTLPAFDPAVVAKVNVMRDQRGVVLHLADKFTRQHLELDPEAVLEMVIAGVGFAKPTYAAAHRWRYALTTRPLGESHLWHQSDRLGICGDWCLGEGVREAVQSGLAMASAIT